MALFPDPVADRVGATVGGERLAERTVTETGVRGEDGLFFGGRVPTFLAERAEHAESGDIGIEPLGGTLLIAECSRSEYEVADRGTWRAGRQLV